MIITIAPSQPPHWAPSPSPSPTTTATTTITTTTTMINNQSSSSTSTPPPPSKLPVDFSPPLIAMVVIVATAFLIVTYSRLISRHLLPPLLRILRRFRRWRHRRLNRRRLHFLPSSVSDLDSPPFDPSFSAFHALSPYGLDESSIKTIPLSIFTKNNNTNSTNKTKDCAVCLLEFEENDYVRTLPVCSHAFHVDCIDIWLRSHANCPLCRAGIFITESPFIPVMAARIRPSFDDVMLTNITSLETLTEISPVRSFSTVAEITPCIDESSPPPRRYSNSNLNSEERFNGGRDLLLKRSYSFGFERNLMNERMIMEPATTSPWRHRRGGGGGGSFWNKRPSPFGSITKSRVFSFRHYRGMKSPFFRRRGGFFPLSERFVSGGGGGSSRRSKSMTSPMFMRSSGVAAFSSSRLRCGDPEALLSPERFNRR